MPFDAVFMSCLKKEIEAETAGLKIDKVNQPDRDTIVLNLRGKKLLISLNSSGGRVSVTGETFENPQTPPMFCMLLRKYLTGGKIISLRQPPLERVYDFEIETYDALGKLSRRHLIVELLGRYTNLILTDGDMIITDCVRRIGFDISDKRQVLPGLLYREPPKTGRRSPILISEDEFCAALNEAGETRLDKWLGLVFDGFSPLICREIIYRAYGTADIRVAEAIDRDGGEGLKNAFFGLMSDIKDGRTSPYILYGDDGKPYDFSYTEIRQYGHLVKIDKKETFSSLLAEFYSKRDKINRMHTKTQALARSIRRQRDRTVRRTSAQREELLLAEDRELYRENGDLITSNLYKMTKGMDTLIADDYYNPEGGTREIKLDPLKTPQQNAAKYYRDYSKAKTAEIHLKEQIRKGETEAEYLDSILEELEKAETEKDIAEIRQELADSGYLRLPKGSKKEKRVEQKPLHFRSTSGVDIFVGKNNVQNDRLTFKTALRYDTWLHVQKIHGSHVIISAGGAEPDRETLLEAASLAALFSRGKESENVPVDYTQVKFVKKPSGARPGMVIYENYKTLFVTPDEELAEKLKVK